jgi:two-component system, NtrC family, response regulator AtoC
MAEAEGGRQPRVVVFWEGGFSVRSIPYRGVLTFGRSGDCDVRIDQPSVSRTHAALHVGEEFLIEDLGSSNGTRVAGQPVEKGQRVPVTPGEVIELGSTMFVVQRSAGGGAPMEVTARIPGDGGDRPIETRPALVISDPAMAQVHRLIAMLARAPMSAILCGELGVGKGMVATEIHRLSRRAAQPMLRIDCAAKAETLDSELFGADPATPGMIERAAGGTVFFDEVWAMPLATQANLVHALERREVTRIGGLEAVPIDVRFVAATTRGLDALVDQGAFRPDLYVRLNGISISVPPLRERVLDIVPLAERFLARAAEQARTTAPTLSDGAAQALEQYGWPGNLRELEKVMSKAFASADRSGVVEVEDLPSKVRAREG